MSSNILADEKIIALREAVETAREAIIQLRKTQASMTPEEVESALQAILEESNLPDTLQAAFAVLHRIDHRLMMEQDSPVTILPRDI